MATNEPAANQNQEQPALGILPSAAVTENAGENVAGNVEAAQNAAGNDSNEQQPSDANTKGKGKAKKRKHVAVRSLVWQHFTRYKDKEGHFKEYKNQLNPPRTENSSASEAQSVNEVGNGGSKVSRHIYKSVYKKQISEGGGSDIRKSELELHLNEDLQEDSSDFDILMWWKVNAARFPILSQMAHDILVVPIATVASESAFSTGGRVLDPYRSSLSPKIVEALICTQD